MLGTLAIGFCACLTAGASVPAVEPAAALPRSLASGTAPSAAIAAAIVSPAPTTGASGAVAAASGQGGFVIIGPPVTERGNEISRAADGLFYVTAIVNGAPIRFLVDTGATTIVLTAADAERAGIRPDEGAFSATAETANGRTNMARIVLDEVVVGGTRSHALGAAVVKDRLPVSLLGQNWVARLSSLTISGDRLSFN